MLNEPVEKREMSQMKSGLFVASDGHFSQLDLFIIDVRNVLCLQKNLMMIRLSIYRDNRHFGIGL